MATRKQLAQSDFVRDKIRTSQLINRLSANALADNELMTTSQVNSARILIGKVLPDLRAVEVDGTVRGLGIARRSLL